MKFTCETCAKALEYDPAEGNGALPKGWRMHRIGPNKLLLCSSCGHNAHFAGGISPLLRRRLSEKGIDVDDDQD